MTSKKTIDTLLQEDRVFAPHASFVNQANAGDPSIYKHGEDVETYWEEQAKTFSWMKPWSKVLDWNLPFAKWFVGATLNITVNCLDRHIDAGMGNKVCWHFEGEPGDSKTLTYEHVLAEVCRLAHGLRALGVSKGDRVTIYMGMIPELAISMLACARIGAAHSVVFGGFSPDALVDRITDSKSHIVLTADGSWRRGGVVPLKANVDEACRRVHGVDTVVVVKRIGDLDASTTSLPMQEGRDRWYHDIVEGQPDIFDPEPMDAEDLLYVLYTSGTTGKPKGIAHTTGGYMVGTATTHRLVFDIKPDDVYWCAADIGWVTGHSYIVYGPLCNATTGVMYEGAPNFPEKDRLWSIVARYGVTILYTAPTAVRAFMGWGTQYPERHDLSSLRLLGSVGEPINPEAWMWYHKHIGGERCPIVDTWWQTETGAIMVSPLPGITPTKPGSACRALPGISVDVVDDDGKSVEKGGGGYLVIDKPWPSMLRTVYGDDQRYKDVYWSKFPGKYFPGDGCKQDDDGYLWLLGRVDDIMLVSGHNISTMEVESALVDHESVAESAVVGAAHAVKGQAIAAFVTLRGDATSSDELKQTLRAHVAKKIGAIGRPDEIYFTADLPKTRSGKIMRRLLRAIADGEALGDTTTLADPAVVEALRDQYADGES